MSTTVNFIHIKDIGPLLGMGENWAPERAVYIRRGRMPASALPPLIKVPRSRIVGTTPEAFHQWLAGCPDTTTRKRGRPRGSKTKTKSSAETMAQQ